ncbi:hypothetical protein QQS21_000684 [Conoideocrella luteorostrata]|uniref:Transglutaminase-like domain-containing protein n=1 Tax=Conoideocrella luteorostrata TaxID=1105319 RepID=A0AAJ0CYM2_9HYPO|nr:hypothetical protein QQS21_000684 [Conoideocrella luteorostrata]
MADTDEPQYNTLAERIAALNQQKNFNVSSNGSAAPRKRPPPPPPPGKSAPPPLPRRDTSTSIASNGTSSTVERAVPPPLPGRTPSMPLQTSMQTPMQTPPLPRRTSTQSTTYLTARRNSASSEISQHSTVSTSSLGRIPSSNTSCTSGASIPRKNMPPATYDPAELPPLPQSKRDREKVAKETAAREAAEREIRGREIRARQATALQQSHTISNNVSPVPSPAPTARPSLPPRLPSRPARSPNPPPSPAPTPAAIEEQKPAPRKLPFGTIKGFGSGQSVKAPSIPAQRPKIPSRPSTVPPDDAPPPVPLTSRPSISQIEAASTRTTERQQNGNGVATANTCWVCRDWSSPDAVGAQFPSQSLPRHDPVGHLARGLCDPFPSYDDKARAIFTWCHHNINYDTVSFFGNNVRHHSVEDTIFSGLAVCQGYAEVYKAIANRAGLECVVVSGHGKGFGHKALKKGERPPPAKPDGHAWNAVRVDGGAWKLIDACWGAGHICSAANLYKKEFSPQQFTLSNEQIGQRHFPQNPSYQFRSDGRTQSWEEYYTGGIDGEPHQWFGTGDKEGIAQDSVEPKSKEISVYSGQVVRFQFSRNCEHWTSEKAGLGKPALFLLSIHGLDGRKDDQIPIETNGYWNWVDVNARDLGAPGQSVEILKLETMDDRDGRGVTAKEFLSKKGRVGMSWSYIAKWELV